MFILDTVTASTYLDYPTPYLLERMESTPPEHVYISDIVVHEMLWGTLSELRKYERELRAVRQYEYLREALTNIQKFQILPYDVAAEAVFRQRFGRGATKGGTHDLQIAAIAISHDFTVITRNISHFEHTGAKFQNWIDRPLT